MAENTINETDESIPGVRAEELLPNDAFDSEEDQNLFHNETKPTTFALAATATAVVAGAVPNVIAPPSYFSVPAADDDDDLSTAALKTEDMVLHGAFDSSIDVDVKTDLVITTTSGEESVPQQPVITPVVVSGCAAGPEDWNGTLVRSNDVESPCNVCGVVFPSKGLLYDHLVIKHPNSSRKGKTVSCEVCGKMISSSSALKTHKLIHTGERPFECQKCGKKFISKSSLNSHHRKVHENVKRSFICDFCGASFGQSGTLTQHRRVHTQEKLYTCEICNKGFSWRGSLKAHIPLFHGPQKKSSA